MKYFSGIDVVIIPVSNVDAAVAWYGKNLGALPSEYALDSLVPLIFQGVRSPSIQLLQVHSETRLRLMTDDYPVGAFSLVTHNAKELYSTLKSRGVTVFAPSEDEDGKSSFVFEDLDGNYITITDDAWEIWYG